MHAARPAPLMQIARRQWMTAVALALTAHAGAAGSLAWSPERTGAEAVGRGGTGVSLALAGGAPAAATAAATATVAMQSPAELAADARPVPETATPQTVDAVAEVEPISIDTSGLTATAATSAVAVLAADSVAAAPAEMTVVRDPETAAPAISAIAPAAKSDMVLASLPTTAQAQPPRPAYKPRPLHAKEVAPERPAVGAAIPDARPVPRPATAPAMAAAKSAEPVTPAETAMAAAGGSEEVQALAALAPAAGGSGGAVKGRHQGADAGASDGGGRQGSMADFAALLQAWLEQHKRYPASARRRNERGVVRLRFVLLQDGRISDYEVVESSGSLTLDDAARKLLERAQPMPAIPRPLGRTQLEFVVPIAYELR